jgi:hypothetical protein
MRNTREAALSPGMRLIHRQKMYLYQRLMRSGNEIAFAMGESWLRGLERSLFRERSSQSKVLNRVGH